MTARVEAERDSEASRQAYRVVYDRNRFPEQPRREDGTWGCRGCGGVIPKSRQTWCSKACCNKWHPAFVMENVRKRDKDICVLCGFDLKKAEAQWWIDRPDSLRVGWAEYSKWQYSKPKVNYDHIIPFSEGGMTVLENIRTLCEDCHKKRTKDWHGERKKKRRLSLTSDRSPSESGLRPKISRVGALPKG